MKNKTLKELRELAKARGLKGYSKLTKEELVHQLDRGKPAGASGERAAKAPKETRRKPKTEKSPVAAAQPPAAASARATGPAGAGTPFASGEERVEQAKYALRPNGRPAMPPAADLDENIDQLPPLTEPLVGLLPQKPGILHAYWALPPREGRERGDYKLRLCRTTGQALEVHEEVEVRTERGHWYFHVSAPSGDAGMLVQLGYYRDGEFVTARGRSIARLPTLYASARTDERWWVDEGQFLAMYLRAGGFVTPARRFGWAASAGSPAGASQSSDQQLAWPGGVSSPSKTNS